MLSNQSTNPKENATGKKNSGSQKSEDFERTVHSPNETMNELSIRFPNEATKQAYLKQKRMMEENQRKNKEQENQAKKQKKLEKAKSEKHMLISEISEKISPNKSPVRKLLDEDLAGCLSPSKGESRKESQILGKRKVSSLVIENEIHLTDDSKKSPCKSNSDSIGEKKLKIDTRSTSNMSPNICTIPLMLSNEDRSEKIRKIRDMVKLLTFHNCYIPQHKKIGEI